MTISITGAHVASSGEIQKRDVFISNNTFAPAVAKASTSIDATGLILSPGLIDFQLYGYGGKEFCDDAEALFSAQKNLPSFGVTSFLPTLGSLPKEKYKKTWMLDFLERSKRIEGAEPIGWHLEGPFLNPVVRGVHKDVRLLKSLDEPFWREIFSSGAVVAMTLAPEITCAKYIFPLLKEYGIIPSIGHTSAGGDVARAAKNYGASFVTHLFNGMPSFHHRRPGIIGEVLGNKLLPFSIIADGVHLSDETIRMCYKCYPEGIVLISDASSFLGAKTTEGEFLGEKVRVRGYALYCLAEDKLAGTLVGLDQMVRSFQKATGCSFAFAVQAASERPAEVLKIGHKKGKIALGLDADCVFWQGETVIATIGRGKILYATKEFLQQRMRHSA
jgi:N-acetylglucosamine-6-phosphate deacetylase